MHREDTSMRVGHISVSNTYYSLWNFFFILDVTVFGLQKKKDRNKHWIFTLLFHCIDFTVISVGVNSHRTVFSADIASCGESYTVEMNTLNP